MKHYIKIILMVVLFNTATSCDRDEVFEREQYKNTFAIVSGDDNVFRVLHDYRMPLSTGYISASLGGSKFCESDIVITMVEDKDVLENYNISLFQEDRDRYVEALNTDKYSFDGYTMTIRAGTTQASLPVTIKAEGLSPDSVFYIPMRVDTYNTGELNMEKGTILYEVRTKNWWCTYNGTPYVSRGLRYEAGMVPTNIYINKNLYPLAATTVRLMAGTESERDNSNNSNFKAFAISVQINDNMADYKIDGIVKTGSPVIISPFGTIEVEQVTEDDPDYDPDYPNIAIDTDDDGYRIYKSLLLNYRYIDSGGRSVRITEEIRVEYIENVKNPRFLN